MTALWISLAVVVVLFLAWRLRKASKRVDQILREERERPVDEGARDEGAPDDGAVQHDESRAEHRNR